MKKITIITFLLLTIVAVGQRKYAADRYFKEFAYVKSISLYEKIYQKGDTSLVVLSRLGDANYFNNNTSESEKWYQKLFKSHKDLSPEYYFRYAQSLKSNGKYKESDQWMLKLKELKNSDSRAASVLKNSDYYKDFTTTEKKYINVNNVSANTAYSDYGVHITDKGILFSSTRPKENLKGNRIYKWNNQPFLNLYSTQDTILTTPEGVKNLDLLEPSIVKEVNTRYHEASAIVTKDGKTMYFTRDNYDGKKLRSDKRRTAHLKIYKADMVAGKWSNITELPFNSDNFSNGHPALSLDEQTLYFVSDREGGVGATDIYKVAINSDNTYGEPVSLGNTINTEGKEMFPVIGNKGTLYFSSDGHAGLGGLDVFESKIIGDSYTTPINLGIPVNSKKDDFSLVFNQDGKSGYFSSNREGGKGDDDIYSFILYSCNEFMDGVVFNSKTKEVLAGAVVKLIDTQGKVIATQTTDEKGYYTFGQVDCSKNFTVVGEKLDFKSDRKEVVTLEEDQLTIKTNLYLRPLVVEDQIVINPIYFDFDLYNIREDAEYELEHIVSVMNNHPEMVIKIESHTDSRGTKQYNKTLSSNRANSTKAYLISRGISKERIESAKGYGEDRLLNHCDDANQKSCSEEEHQLNRRSYFYIVKGGKNVKTNNN
mgnify:CR=1 FL=1